MEKEELEKYLDAAANFYYVIPLGKILEMLKIHNHSGMSEDKFIEFAENYANSENSLFYILGMEEFYTEEPVSKPLERMIVTMDLYDIEEKNVDDFYDFFENRRTDEFNFLPYEEFIKYADMDYMPTTEYSLVIEDFLCEELGVSSEVAKEKVFALYCQICFETSTPQNTLKNFIEIEKVKFSKKQFEDFLPLFSDFHNNTRLPLNGGFSPNEMRENVDYSIHLEENPEAAKFAGLQIPSQKEIEEKTNSLNEYWEKTPWHNGGAAVIKKLNQNLRKHSDIFSQVPENIMGKFFDMYLACDYHKNANRGGQWGNQKWNYYAYEIEAKLGEDLYLCKRNDGEKIIVNSHSVTSGLEEGKRIALSILIDCGGWFRTYGAVLLYKGIYLFDFDFLAKEIAPQMYKANGFSSVVAFDPVSFWATVRLCNIPAMGHGNELIIDCYQKGVLDIEKLTLPKTWRYEKVGGNHRWIYKYDKFFERQSIYWNEKKKVAYIMAHSFKNFEILCSKVRNFFTSNEEVERCSFSMSTFVFGDLKKDLPMFTLENLFENEG